MRPQEERQCQVWWQLHFWMQCRCAQGRGSSSVTGGESEPLSRSRNSPTQPMGRSGHAEQEWMVLPRTERSAVATAPTNHRHLQANGRNIQTSATLGARTRAIAVAIFNRCMRSGAMLPTNKHINSIFFTSRVPLRYRSTLTSAESPNSPSRVPP